MWRNKRFPKCNRALWGNSTNTLYAQQFTTPICTTSSSIQVLERAQHIIAVNSKLRFFNAAKARSNRTKNPSHSPDEISAIPSETEASGADMVRILRPIGRNGRQSGAIQVPLLEEELHELQPLRPWMGHLHLPLPFDSSSSSSSSSSTTTTYYSLSTPF